jgi:hypothetical protein
MEGAADLDELGFPQKPQLAAHGGSAESELGRQTRRPARADGHRRDDPTPRRIRQQLDPGSVPRRHLDREACVVPMHGRLSAARPPLTTTSFRLVGTTPKGVLWCPRSGGVGRNGPAGKVRRGGPDGSPWLEPQGERRCARTCWRGRRVRTGGDGGGGPARSATGGTVAWRCSIGDRPHDGPGDRPSGRMVPLGWNNRERDVVCEVCPPGG